MKWLVLLLLPMQLGSCVTAPKYPDDWVPGFPEHYVFARSGGRYSLTGSYADSGEPPKAAVGQSAVSLYRMLCVDSTLPLDLDLDGVSLHGPENAALEATAWKDGVPIETRRLRGFGCLENGLVNINPEGGGSNCIATLCAGARDDFLFRGVDGSLVLKRNSLIVVLPWFQWQTYWYRFGPLPSLTGIQ